MILCISVLSVVISPLSFLILLIWFFSLCFLMSLANHLSILFISSKNQLLALLIFAMVSFVSFSLTSALIFMIPFLLLTLEFFISSFSSCFRCRVSLFIWLYSCFLRYLSLHSLTPPFLIVCAYRLINLIIKWHVALTLSPVLDFPVRMLPVLVSCLMPRILCP